MSYSEIASAIVDQIKTASGTDKVYAYERWAANWGAILNLFKTDEELIHAWMVSRMSVHRRVATIGGPYEIAHVFRVRAVYGMNDAAASETIFQGIIDTVAAAFDADPRLGGTCMTTYAEFGPMQDQPGLQVEGIDIRTFGTVLCHHADCRICAVERS